MSCIYKYKGKKYSEEQFKEYLINNKQEFTTSIAKNKDIIDSFKRKMEGIDFVFSQSPELASVGSKAQYLQYLSTIFPNSKVKDIVYHGTNAIFEKFEKGFGKWSDAFWFDTKNTYKLKYQIKALINSKNPFSYNIVQIDKIIESIYGQEQLNELHKYLTNPSNLQLYVKEDEFEIEGEIIINYTVYDTIGTLIKSFDTKELGDEYVKNNSPKLSKVKQEVIDLYETYTTEQHPDVEGGQFIKKEEIQKLQKAGFDSLIYNDYKVVFEPEQIHILSSKADIQGFKDFMSFENSEFSKYGTYQQFRDFITSKFSIEIENRLIETGKINRVC